MDDPKRRALDVRIRPTRAEVDLAALRANLSTAKKLAAPAEILAVVKANAYGHGAVPVARALEEAGVRFLGVALIEEGVELRNAGLRSPILVLGGSYEGGYELMVEHALIPTVFRADHLTHLAKAANGRRVEAHLKVDTGMGRIGVSLAELEDFLGLARRTPEVVLDGLASHFANADLADAELTGEQLSRFAGALKTMRAKGFDPRWRHLSNSAGVIDHRGELELNLVRPGLMLYGLSPASWLGAELKPVLSWKTGVTHLKDVEAGTPVSYGSTWRAGRRSRIATLPVGYADGYSRSFSNKAQVLVRGHRAPVVGRVCMDMTMIDVTDVPGVQVGDDVTLLGGEITADELARLEGTISYEVLCAVSARVPRIAV